ncbi:hypothetical protein ACJW31_04G054700 [Castanea mollissima]
MKKSISSSLPKDLNPTRILPHKTQNLRDLYKLGHKLGQGFGTTYLGTDNSTGQNYACRSIPKHKLFYTEDYDDVLREIQIMQDLSEQPHVVKIRGGELFHRIVRKGHYSEREAAKLMKTIVKVEEACHSVGIMHRDLKPENFLFHSLDEDAAFKATDFGLSVFYRPDQIFFDIVGSPYHVAPEVLCKRYGPEADVWSAGVILYILLSGTPPFWAESEKGIFQLILQGKLDLQSEPWPSISDSAKDLIRKMLNRDPKKRLTAREVLYDIAPDEPLDSVVVSRLKQFSAMNKLKKMALRVIAERLSEEEIGDLKELFKTIDSDNSGTITLDELRDGLKRVNSELIVSEINDLMDAADFDNSGTIDYGEFLAITMHWNKLEREETVLSAFFIFDKDGSGYITIDELQQACKGFGLCDVHLEEMIKEIDQDKVKTEVVNHHGDCGVSGASIRFESGGGCEH